MTDGSGNAPSVEMLPGSYAFAMTYNGTREQVNGVGVSGSSSTVPFQTTAVTAQLVDHTGTAGLAGGSASYYAAGWHAIGVTDGSGNAPSVEMLPGSYAFAMTYNGTREQVNGVGVSGSSSTVTFQTTQVVSSSGSAGSYYASGWRPFTSPGELLPGTYTFHFTDGTANTPYAVSGTTTTIH